MNETDKPRMAKMANLIFQKLIFEIIATALDNHFLGLVIKYYLIIKKKYCQILKLF